MIGGKGVRRLEASGKFGLVKLVACLMGELFSELFFAMRESPFVESLPVGFNFTAAQVIGVIGSDAAPIYQRKTDLKSRAQSFVTGN